MEEEQQEHRGFVITVSTQDHRAGGSTVTLLIERPLKDWGRPRSASCTKARALSVPALWSGSGRRGDGPRQTSDR
jgi:hypothetical protein